jgi:hypothetical protein
MSQDIVPIDLGAPPLSIDALTQRAQQAAILSSKTIPLRYVVPATLVLWVGVDVLPWFIAKQISAVAFLIGLAIIVVGLGWRLGARLVPGAALFCGSASVAPLGLADIQKLQKLRQLPGVEKYVAEISGSGREVTKTEFVALRDRWEIEWPGSV